MAQSGTDVDPAQVGILLREARAQRGLDAGVAAGSAGLSTETITALEEEDPAAWAADSRMLASLRMYARFLDADPEPMVRAVWGAARARHPSADTERVEPLRPGAAYPHKPPQRRHLVAGAAAGAVLLASAAGVVVSAVVAGEGPQAPGVSSDESTASVDGDEASDPVTSAADPLAGTEADEGTTDEAVPSDDAGQPSGADTPAASGDDLPGRPPEDTTVQVLNALENEEATAEVVERIEALGYDVVLVDTTIRTWPETGVYFDDGWESEAEGLNARDDRFPVEGANEAFVDEADLHVVVGLDWTE